MSDRFYRDNRSEIGRLIHITLVLAALLTVLGLWKLTELFIKLAIYIG